MNTPSTLVTPVPTVPKTAGEPPRRPRWETARRAFLLRSPRCAACGDAATPAPGTLNVHHVVPFHLVVRAGRPDLELDPRNLITLCEGGANHHLVVGHLDDWESYNTDVRADASRPDCHGLARSQIVTLTWWVAARTARPRRASLSSPTAIATLRASLDRLYPRPG